MSDVFCVLLPFSLRTLSQGQKLILSLDAGEGFHKLCNVQTQETILEEFISVQEGAQLNLDDLKLLFCMYYHLYL